MLWETNGLGYHSNYSCRLANVVGPTAAQDVATKYYVDTQSIGGGLVKVISGVLTSNVLKSYSAGWRGLEIIQLEVSVPDCRENDYLEITASLYCNVGSTSNLGDRIRFSIIAPSGSSVLAHPVIMPMCIWCTDQPVGILPGGAQPFTIPGPLGTYRIAPQTVARNTAYRQWSSNTCVVKVKHYRPPN